MTVCIAARSGTALFLVSDRILTSGDVQFEPPAGKIIFVTSCIAVMAAGDSAFHHELMTDVWKEVAQVIERKPEEWIGVRHVVDMYINYRNMAKRKRSEASILAPLGLNHSSFLDQQRTMSDDLVREITTDLINFDLPDVQVIVAGIDTYMDGSKPNTHIYSIHNDFVSCDDIIGFRAIGSGARHAESQFMLAGHSWNNDPHATVMLTYRAKKDSEVAPGWAQRRICTSLLAWETRIAFVTR